MRAFFIFNFIRGENLGLCQWELGKTCNPKSIKKALRTISTGDYNLKVALILVPYKVLYFIKCLLVYVYRF